MPTFDVELREMHISKYTVEADDAGEARELVLNQSMTLPLKSYRHVVNATPRELVEKVAHVDV